jgi:hypothetical protein
MSTRAQVRFATREEGVSFSEHPNAIHAQFYVHYDGYPEGLGLEIAKSLVNPDYGKIHDWEIESLDARHGDVEYIYYIWQAPQKTTWISIFEVRPWPVRPNHDEDICIFVGRPSNLIDKYKINTNAYG